MRYTRSSLAEEIYDFPYEEPAKRVKHEPGDSINGNTARKRREKQNEEQQVSALHEIEIKRANKKVKQSLLGCIALVFILASILMCRYASIYEMNYRTDRIVSETELLKAENRRLEAVIQSESNLVNIDSIAQNELGLQKPQPYQTIELTVTPVDQTHLVSSVETESKEKDVVWYEDIFNNIKDFFGFIDYDN